MSPRLIPELDVADLPTSRAFYVDIVGCQVRYERPEEHFVFLDLEGAHFMLEEQRGPVVAFAPRLSSTRMGAGLISKFKLQTSRRCMSGFVPPPLTWSSHLRSVGIGVIMRNWGTDNLLLLTRTAISSDFLQILVNAQSGSRRVGVNLNGGGGA